MASCSRSAAILDLSPAEPALCSPHWRDAEAQRQDSDKAVCTHEGSRLGLVLKFSFCWLCEMKLWKLQMWLVLRTAKPRGIRACTPWFYFSKMRQRVQRKCLSGESEYNPYSGVPHPCILMLSVIAGIINPSKQLCAKKRHVPITETSQKLTASIRNVILIFSLASWFPGRQHWHPVYLAQTALLFTLNGHLLLCGC